MDEAKADRAGGIYGKQAVGGKIAFPLFEGGGQVIGSIVLVMEMDFRFATSGPAKACESREDFRAGLLDGMKKSVGERMPGRVADGIGKMGKFLLPAVEACESLCERGIMAWLEMIADAEDEMDLA